MDITPIGYLALPAFGLMSLLRPELVLYTLIAFTGFSATSLVNVYGITFGLQPYFYLAGLAAALFSLGIFRIEVTTNNMNIALLAVLFLLAIVLSLLSASVHEGLRFSNITQTGFIIVGLATTAMVTFYFRTYDRLRAGLITFAGATCFVSLWGIWQLVAFYTGAPYPAWIFNNSVSDSADMFEQVLYGNVRIASVAVEPSFFARYVVAGIGVCLTCAEATVAGSRGRQALFLALAFVSLVAAVLSTSTSAYVGLAVLLPLWAAADLRRVAGGAALSMGGLVLMSAVTPQRLEAIFQTTLEKTSSGSFYERSATITDALSAFKNHIFFGHGWDELAVYDLFVALLFHTGIVGLAAFLALVAYAVAGPRPALRPGANAAAIGHIRTGLRNTLIAVIAVDAVSGFSHVAATLWVVLGLTFAANAIRSSDTGLRGHAPARHGYAR